MRNFYQFVLRALTALALVTLCSVARAADAVEFEADIAPILRSHCAGCHNADDAEGGFAIDSTKGLLTGGDSGVAVTPGSAASSRMWLMLSGKLDPAMPPADETQLDEQQLAAIEAWIEQGAKVSAGEGPVRPVLRMPKIVAKAGVHSPVTAMATSRDGSIRAAASFGRIDLTGNALTDIERRDRDSSIFKSFSGDFGKVNSLQFNADGSRLLAASGATGAYGVATIYSIETDQPVIELMGHRDILYSAIFSPDESIVATAGYDRQIILWNAETAEPLRTLVGHNGAIFDLAFSPDGRVLVSACADQTVKVWNVQSGERLDTLSQSEGEVYAVDITPDGKQILAAGADNRLRVWSLESVEEPMINPLIETRFVDESPLINFAISPDGKSLIVISQAGNAKVIRTSDWNQAASLEPLGEMASDLVFSADGRTVLISLMNGDVVSRPLPRVSTEPAVVKKIIDPIYMDLGDPPALTEAELRAEQQRETLSVGRGVQIAGAIDSAGDVDHYQWFAHAGEVWAIDADAIDKSMIDTIVSLFDSNDQPVLRTRLQAVRDSYFTFRGKDSSQTSDFRLFNWQEIKLNDYLYAAGEVTRLYMHPRGPDSGFNVYPDEGSRWTFFGSSPRAHALGEPAYIVQPIGLGETPTANGLPVFDVFYENDDDPSRQAGTNSRVLFTAPHDGPYTVRITDTRGEGGENFGYRLSIRAANPRFQPSIGQPNSKILKGSGREFQVRVDRYDGFDGPVTFELVDLPPGLVSNSPITVEDGQRFATANLWADESAADWEGEQSVKVIARATVGGRHVEREAGRINKLTLGDRPQAIASVHPVEREVPENESWTLQVRRGETATARILVRRKEGFNNEIRFGSADAGRNATHGVYVDNIGLSGLLVRAGENEREFFLTADPIARPGKRSFHLQAEIDGKVTTYPMMVEVLP